MVIDLGRAQRPMRILFSSNGPHVGTGYGAQTALAVPRLSALGHDMAVFAWYGVQGAPLNYGFSYRGETHNALMYPGGRDGYGNDLVHAYAEHHRADVVISLIDAWVLDPQAHGGAQRWCPWFPVDAEPIPPRVLDSVRHALRPIVYSRFGEQMCHAAGLDVAYVPHMVDAAVFAPGDKATARAALGISPNVFLVLMVAANKDFPSRKAYPQALRAFKALHERHPDARLYLHTVLDGGTNLRSLIERLDISDAVIPANQVGIVSGAYGDDHMVALYRAADVLLSPSLGEGFGVPILEAQACGTPVIAGAWTAMEELIFAGWPIAKRDAEPFDSPLEATQYVARVDAITDALEAAYSAYAAGVMPDYADAARRGAMAYDADVVTRDYWRPVLDEIAEQIGVATVESEVAA